MVRLRYESNTARYRNLDTGRFVPRTDVITEKDKIVERLKNELRDLAIRYDSGALELQSFQIRMAQAIQDAHIQAAGLASGGVARLTRVHFRDISERLEDEFTTFLGNYGRALATQEFSAAQIIARTQSYARSVSRSFNAAEKITRISDGVNQAKRTLDPAAQHCIACPNYDTGGRWIPADQVVPVGEACPCGGNCRCTVIYRFNPRARAISLSDRLVG